MPKVERTNPPLFERVLRPLQSFFAFEAAGGVLLLLSTLVALAWANSPWAEGYSRFLEVPFVLGFAGQQTTFSLHHLVNDGLMTVFFFVVGMEIKRELVVGELRTLDRALLPAIAAVGGMIAPAAIYAAFNWNTPAMSGWAIPMATDIAFSLGLLTVLKSRVPWGLIVFLTALAIFDDMGGIAVIAIFYGTGIDWSWLLIALLECAALAAMGFSQVRNGLFWAVGLAMLWYALGRTGIHATLSGVALGLMIPARSRLPGRAVLSELATFLRGVVQRPVSEDLSNQEILQIEERLEDLEPPINRFVNLLHPFVAFGIVPLFALVNAGVDLRQAPLSSLVDPVPLGIATGLFVGKQVGIYLFSFLCVRFKFAPMPGDAHRLQLWGVSVVGGIGFTVALFVATLAFRENPHLLDEAKLGILVGSLASALVGYAMLRFGPAAPVPVRS